jgi:putative FmdB family regulatory protein
MPLYEYQCENCGDIFELMQKFADAPIAVHEKCGGPVHRLLSAPALQFKGSGWYVNDYAKGSNSSGGNGNSKKGDAPSGASSDSGSTSSSDSAKSSSDSAKSPVAASSSSETK